MAEIVNLRLARKRRDRQAKETAADANRVLHGLTRVERSKIDAERRSGQTRLDGHRREKPDDGA